ncbi:MAG: ABC transporter permease [Actinobacteria bacterium]|nr:ABC transporter permease [Actinomycetota bacterium]
MNQERLVGLLWGSTGLTTAAGLAALGVLPTPVIVLSVPFVVLGVRRPVLRRLALRNASRRPRETALILLGALLGTAIITGSAIVGDTLGASIRRSAFTQQGPVDAVVRTTSGFDRRAELFEAVAAGAGGSADGLLALVSIDAAVATPVPPDRGSGPQAPPRAEPHASVLEVDFREARRFGGDPGATGITGPTPAGGTAAIGRDLARTLAVGPGDRVDVYAYGNKRSFTVERVLPRLGVAGLHFGFGSESPNLFVPPGTVAEMVAAGGGAGAPPTALVAVSNRGGVIQGAEGSDDLVERISEKLAENQIPAQTAPVKQELLDSADEQGRQFTELFTSIGFFSVIAGILLLVSIFVMLAEERKKELGMLRAVGLRRSGLVGSFSLEGWMYALASAALGTVAGLGVGRAIVFVTAGIFQGEGPLSLEIKYAATLASVQRGFLTGFVMSLLTVLATSLWISRLNVIRAIRDLPEPPVKKRRLAVSLLRLGSRALAALAGTLVTVAGLSLESAPALLVGPPLAALGVAAVVRDWLGKRGVDTAAAAFSLTWAVASFDVFPQVFKNPEIYLFVLDGVILTVAAVILVSRHQVLIGRAVRRLGGGSKSMALRLGLAYPLARAFRTSIILMTFALTMFTLVSITLFSGVFQSQIDDFTEDVSGGFDIRALSNPSSPVAAEEVAREPGISAVAPLAALGAEFQMPSREAATGSTGRFGSWSVAGYDSRFADVGPPSLQKFLPRFRTAEEAWRGVAGDPTLIIVDDFFLQAGGGPPEASPEVGDKVIIRDPASGTTRELTIAAVANAGVRESPAYMGLEGLRQVVGDQAVPNLLYVKTEPGVDAQSVAERLNGRFLSSGMDAVSFRKLVGDGLASQQQFFRLMQGYLALGLVVGVAGLGVVMVRAVRERRREVGVLRSLGFDSRQVRRAFMAESSFVALEGIITGTLLAHVSTWRLLNSGAFGESLRFSIPWSQVALVVVLAFFATLVATVTPAQQASQIRPAVALRIAD